MVRILYTCTDSPPGRAVQMALKYLNLDYEYKDVDFDNGEHFSPTFLKMYPQGEIPVLDDNGFILGESVAINQYLADEYAVDDTFYPKSPKIRAIVNHRLAFHVSTYYRRIHDYMILPMDYKLERTADNLKKLNHAVQIFNKFLKDQGTSYVAGEHVTIADLSLLMGTIALDAMEYDFKPFPEVLSWYKNFQSSQVKLWDVAKEGLAGLTYYNKNPRDLSHLNHPLHPTK